MPVSCHQITRPDRCGTMRWKPALNAFAITSADRGDLLNETAGNTVPETDPWSARPKGAIGGFKPKTSAVEQRTLVELRGFEPLTFSLRTRRATNCAIAPWTRKRYQPRPTRLSRGRRTTYRHYAPALRRLARPASVQRIAGRLLLGR